jgi:NADH-quinone oxidoreductase subunit N
MLYGISLVTAITGSGDLPTVSRNLFAQPLELAGVAGLLFIGIGIGYKLSVVPFHVWLPDAFEGASAEVGAFLSVASKAAALALLARLLVKCPHADWCQGLMIFGAITATFGNLLAYAQTNLKRLLGYSTIAHAGFLLAGVATMTVTGLAATLVYLMAYLLANLGAFAAVAAIRNSTGREDVSSLGGLMKHSPLLGVGFAICILSLLGLPPLAGFAGKFLVFSAVWSASHGVFVVLMINTAIAAGYYLRLLRVMTLDDATFEPTAKIPTGLPAFTFLLALASVLLGVLWSPLLDWAKAAAVSLH